MSSTDAGLALAADNRAVLAAKGKTFAWASVVLPAQARDDAALLYAFCRLADDVVDEASSATAARSALTQLTAEVNGTAPRRALVEAFCAMRDARGIPHHAVTDLLLGMESDLLEVRIASVEALRVYAYRVAGTVGLMMSPILGVTDATAAKHAAELGIAMQLTNIARDITEDAQRGRVYLPRAWLLQARVTPDEVVSGRANHTALASVLARTIALAEDSYREGEAGLRFIPWRARLAIYVAARVYREIGALAVARQQRALTQRTVVSTSRKLWVTAGAVLAFVRGLFG